MRSIARIGNPWYLPVGNKEREKKGGKVAMRDGYVDRANNRGSLNFHFCAASAGRINGLDAKRARNKFAATLRDSFDALFAAVKFIQLQLLDFANAFFLFAV